MCRKRDFKERLAREIRLHLREMRDGCVECRAVGGDGYCDAHFKVACEIITNPKKHLNIKSIRRAEKGRS